MVALIDAQEAKAIDRRRAAVIISQGSNRDTTRRIFRRPSALRGF